MAEGLTVDNLAETIKQLLHLIASNPSQPVDQARGIILCGVPGDLEMNELLELYGGTIKITICKAPTGIVDDILAKDFVREEADKMANQPLYMDGVPPEPEEVRESTKINNNIAETRAFLNIDENNQPLPGGVRQFGIDDPLVVE